MNQKVWHIGEQEWDWDSPPGKKDGAAAADRPVREKPRSNPAWSYSLSFLLWGGGQLYSGRKAAGALLLMTMFLFSAAVGGLVVAGEYLHRWYQAPVMAPVVLLTGTFIAILLPLTIAFINAVHAYFRTAASRLRPYRGVGNALGPLVCSSVFPGWGQFLNAQPKKGLFFGVFSVLGYSSLAALAVFWRYRQPFLNETADMAALEAVLLGLVFAAAAAPLVWLTALYDAVVTCRDPYRKRPLAKKVVDASRRVGMKRLRAFLPDIRGTVLLCLLLAAVLLAAERYASWDYFQLAAEQLRQAMLEARMETLPGLLGKAMQLIP